MVKRYDLLFLEVPGFERDADTKLFPFKQTLEAFQLLDRKSLNAFNQRRDKLGLPTYHATVDETRALKRAGVVTERTNRVLLMDNRGMSTFLTKMLKEEGMENPSALSTSAPSTSAPSTSAPSTSAIFIDLDDSDQDTEDTQNLEDPIYKDRSAWTYGNREDSSHEDSNDEDSNTPAPKNKGGRRKTILPELLPQTVWDTIKAMKEDRTNALTRAQSLTKETWRKTESSMKSEHTCTMVAFPLMFPPLASVL